MRLNELYTSCLIRACAANRTTTTQLDNILHISSIFSLSTSTPMCVCVCVNALLNHRVPENFHIVLDILLIRCVRRRLLYNIIYTQSANSESKVMGNIDLIYPTKLTCVFAVCARARAPSAPSKRARAYTVRSTDRIGNSVGAASKRCCRAADYDDPL